MSQARRQQNYQNSAIASNGTHQTFSGSMRANQAALASPQNYGSSASRVGQGIKSPTNAQSRHQAGFQSNSRIVPNKRVVIRGGSNAPEPDRLSLQMKQTSSKNLGQENRASSADVVAPNLLYLEDFDHDIDPLFIQQELRPYFQGVFQDLALRSAQSQSNPSLKAIDKVTFVEYVNLPGIVSDRFHSIATQGRTDGRVVEEAFTSLMLQVFSSSLETKMRLTYKIFDFDGDGYISPEEVHILLSYIPFKQASIKGVGQKLQKLNISNKAPAKSHQRGQSFDATVGQNQSGDDFKCEGLYQRGEGRSMNMQQRQNEQKEIKAFVQCAFQDVSKFDFDNYMEFNTQISSEMFVSVMSILQERLPCSNFYFRQRRIFKKSHCKSGNQSPVMSIDTTNYSSDQHHNYSAPSMKNGSGSTPHSPMTSSFNITAIAQPKIIPAYSPTKVTREFKLGGQRASSRYTEESPSFRIKTNSVVINGSKSPTKLAIMNNKRLSSMEKEKNGLMGLKSQNSMGVESIVSGDSAHDMIGIENVDGTSPRNNIVEISKMRRLEDARRKWESRHQSNSPFRAENYASSNSLGPADNNSESSPISIGKGFGMRLGISKGQNGQQMRKVGNMNPSATFNMSNANNSSTFKRSQTKNTSGTNALRLTNSNIGMSSSDNVSASGIFPNVSPQNNGVQQINSCSDLGGYPAMQDEEILDRFADSEDERDNFFEGMCYLKTKTDRFKEHWAVLLGNDIYCYRNQQDKKHRVMHCLAGTFIKEISEESCPDSGKLFYPVKIVLPPNKSRILYFDTKDSAKAWYDQLLQASGFVNLFDFYDLGKVLGKGQFGMVKLAEHKVSKAQVAIKTVKKANMKAIEVFQQRREIEVLKMCQHSNIIKLIDLFENSDYYFLILEYMAGKDLFDYIQKRGFQLPEQRVQELGYQIGLAIQYQHKFGIVHRDLKLENIMMSDGTDNALPKIVDFGLAKIIGPGATATEPFGTLGYVAPEVLLKKPYTFSCDVWSFGCCLYALLSGSLPFDHESQKETIRMTVEDKLVFDLPCWESLSKECKDLISSLLVKDPSKRISLDQALKNPWFDQVARRYGRNETQSTKQTIQQKKSSFARQ